MKRLLLLAVLLTGCIDFDGWRSGMDMGVDTVEAGVSDAESDAESDATMTSTRPDPASFEALIVSADEVLAETEMLLQSTQRIEHLLEVRQAGR